MRTDLRFFHVTTRKRGLRFVGFRWNHNLFRVQHTIDDTVPDISSTQSVTVVGTCLICHSQDKGDEVEFLVQRMNEFNILNVIVDELLVIFFVEIKQGAVFFVVDFTFTKFDSRDVVETIRFLLCVGEFLVDIQVIKMLNTLKDIFLNLLTEVFPIALADDTPRR